MAFSGAGSGSGTAEVWKVTGSDFESVPDDGIFNVDNLYVVLSKKGAGSIHLWSGNVKINYGSAECVSWMDGACALNAASGGNKPIYTEIEGFETNIFISSFKNGLTYKTKASASNGHRLLQVKGKGGKRMKELSMSSSYFASLRDVFILDAEDKIYIQAGPRASLYDRVAASSIADEMNSSRGDSATVVYMFEDAMNEGFWSHFKESAGAPDILCISHEDPSAPTQTASGPKLVKVGGSAPSFSFADDAVSKASFSSSDVVIVLGGGGDIVRRVVFVWVGKGAAPELAGSAVATGFAFIKSMSLPASTPVEVFYEDAEADALKVQIPDWDVKFPMTPYSDSLGLTSIKLPRKMLDDKAKSDNKDVDEGGKVRVWRVEGITRVTMNKTICGQFYSNNCYILLYAYTPAGQSEKYILIYWVGLQSTRDDRGSAAILTKYIGDSLEGKKLVIRVVEGNEPTFLCRLFRGSLMVHRSEAVVSEADTILPKKKSSSLLANFSMKTKQEKGVNALEQLSKMLQNNKVKGTGAAQLFAYVGSSPLTLYAQQVPLGASSLNNKDNFVLFAAKYAFIRVATAALKDAMVRLVETKMKEVDGKADCEVVVFNIGKEPEDFWVKLGSKDVDADKPSYLSKPVVKAPKLYHATARSGAFRVSEVENFKKSDLFDDEVFLLDIYSMIICWVGGAVSTQEADLAIDYGLRLHEALVQIDGRDDESIVVKVESGEEIGLFTDYFLDWDKMDAEVVEQVAQQSEIAAVLQTQKVAYEEALAPQEEPPAEIAKSPSTIDIISPTQEMPQLEQIPISKSSSKVALKPTPVPVAKTSAAASISKWGDFKQDFSFVDIYPKVDPKKRVDYETLKKDYATLKDQNVEVNPMKKELYLDEPIFQELFQCSKAEFEALPVWKRAQMKKKVGLF